MDVDNWLLSGTAKPVDLEDLSLALCTAPCSPACMHLAVSFGLCNGHRMRAAKGLKIDKPLRIRRKGENAKTHRMVLKLNDEQLEALEELAKERGFDSPGLLVLSVVEKLAKTARNSKT